jgi:predicted CXXCH cytochrome family protein
MPITRDSSSGLSTLALLARASLLAAAVAGFACAQPSTSDPYVVIHGPSTVEVGDIINLSASTEHGSEPGYDWTSSDESIATVDGNGLVLGVAPGAATITATGRATDQSADHLVVVVPGTPDSPYEERWKLSPHADVTAESFNHWNAEGEIPTDCGRCHSRAGFHDYIGEDGSEVGVVNLAAPTGTVVDCETCHNDAASALDWAEFPSGATLDELGPEARCITCHQGRASGDDIEQSILAAGVGDDEISADLAFSNIHYYPAGATLYAGIARGGYQYADQLYDRRLRHVPDQQTCVDCHDPHSTEVKWAGCAECHEGVVDGVSARDIRMIASFNVDYDGDGDTLEGVAYELDGLREKLYTGIQRYASDVAGQDICYSPKRPYWYNSDTGATTECSDAQATSDNAFSNWTPRLLRATYNYHSSRQDPAAFVHNNRYIVKLLHDSIVDLNTQLGDPVDMSTADRDAPGHFNGASEAARHWDEDDAVSASCSTCHSGAPGFRFYVEYGTGLEVPETANGMECYTCHENFGTTYATIEVSHTLYPSGIDLEHDGFDNICATCHRGRESKATIDAAIAKDNLKFLNVHYLASASVRNGTESQVGYEYDGKTYAGHLQHANRTQCTNCHDPGLSNHTFAIADVWEPLCQTCHADQAGPELVRTVHLDDYDGDGNTNETLLAELDGLEQAVLAAMRTQAAICYDAHSYPYWFIDNAGSPDGACLPEDANSANGFKTWTPALMKAAHNFQLSSKDPGGYAHNFEYLAQLLIDSVEDLGADPSSFVRP